MSGAGRSAQARAKALRDRRLYRLRRTWPVALVAVIVAFAFGFMLPRVIHGAVSSLLVSLVPEAQGIPEWSFMPTLSLALGTVMALAVAVGFIRPSRSESAWRKGASGERRVGGALDALARRGVHVLHDLAMPGSKANIDHVAVTPSGVFVVDAKRYVGQLEVRSWGSQLWINSRNRSKLLEQAQKQAEMIRAALARAGAPGVPVTPVLCFVDTNIPLFFPPKQIGGVLICTRKSLRKRISQRGHITLSNEEGERIIGILGATFRPAGGTAH